MVYKVLFVQSAANHTKKHRDEPLLLTISVLGSTQGTYVLTSHQKGKAIMYKCLAEGPKCHDRDSNPHSAV